MSAPLVSGIVFGSIALIAVVANNLMQRPPQPPTAAQHACLDACASEGKKVKGIVRAGAHLACFCSEIGSSKVVE